MSSCCYRVEVDAPESGGLECSFRIFDNHDFAGNPDPEPEWEGWVKWDGCINWKASHGNYHHFCGHDNAVDLLEAFAEVRRKTAELLFEYEGDVPAKQLEAMGDE